MTDALPVRYCHGCAQYDDHPRVTHISNMHDPAGDKLYHYDCAPAEVVDGHPEIKAGVDACAKGKRGNDLRDVMVKHAASITEAPADKKKG